MKPISKVRQSVERAGPLLVALVSGVLLVVTSALAYRDARQSAFVVAERQGIGLLLRAEAGLIRRHADPGASAAHVTAVLETNRPLGLTYVAVLDGRSLRVEAAAGLAMLGPALPAVGIPIYGAGRVRMLGGRGPGPGGRPPAGVPLPPGEDPPPGGPPPFDLPPPFPDRASGPPPPWPPTGVGVGGRPWRPAGPPLERRPVVIEFEPIASMDAVRRALVALVLSSGVAASLAAAAAVLWWRARRAEEVERRLAAQEHLASLGEMSAVLAHEIRNPLAALKGHAQLLAERMAGSAEAGRVQRVVDEAIRLEKLIGGLLEFARSGLIDAAPADPVAVLRDAAGATDAGRVDVQSDGAPPSVVMDVHRMRQVLVNLLDNALTVTPPEARVIATVEGRPGGGVSYAIRDRGPGVAAADRARMFRPFFTTKTRGTGLGLAVARRIVSLHGGTLGFSDAPDGGTVFRVELPGAPAGAGLSPPPSSESGAA